tara:strand:- start:2191 stop:3333 length:1143 start_codon:yes stop_codon:yes gene_type:complete
MVLIDTTFGDANGSAPHLLVAPWRAAMLDDAEWDTLAASAAEPNPFFERSFLRPSLDAFDPQGEVKLALLRIDGRLAGLIPLHHARSYYGRPIPHLTSWLHDNAFCGVPLIARGFETMFWSMLLRWADRNAGLAAFLHLPAIPEHCAPDTALTVLTQENARTSGVVEHEIRALLSSDLSPEDYFEQSLSTKKRKELRRQARRLAEHGALTVDRAKTPEAIGVFSEKFLALEKASWKGRAGSSLANDPASARFFRESLIGAAEAGRVEGLSLRLDGEPIAMLVTFLTPPGAFSFKTAFDERFSKFSPGVLLQKENLDLLQGEGIEWCDSCAAPDHPMIDHFWRDQRSLLSRNLSIGGSLRRALGTRLIAYESRKCERSMSQ